MSTYKIMAYDNTYADVRFGVEATWRYGAMLFGSRFNEVIAASSWNDILVAVTAAKAADPQREIELQVWGHGAKGAPLIGRYAANPSDVRWANAHTVWFRCCYAFAGAEGKVFAAKMAEKCRVVAHTVIIGANWGAHSYTYGLEKGALPTWPEVTADVDPIKPLSSPMAPRTVMFWDMTVPAWAFKPFPAGKPMTEVDFVKKLTEVLRLHGELTVVPMETQGNATILFRPFGGVHKGKQHVLCVLAAVKTPDPLFLLGEATKARALPGDRFLVAVPSMPIMEVRSSLKTQGVDLATSFKDSARLSTLVGQWTGVLA